MRGLPAGTRVLELGPGPAHVALLTRRADLCWVGLEGSLDCLPGMRSTLSGGAIVDLEALRDGAEIVVMLHPDGQYDPLIIPEMIRPI